MRRAGSDRDPIRNEGLGPSPAVLPSHATARNPQRRPCQPPRLNREPGRAIRRHAAAAAEQRAELQLHGRHHQDAWEASLHPQRLASTLAKAEIRALRLAIPRVLKRGLKNLGTSLGTGKANFYSVASRRGRNKDQLRVFRRTDLPCPRCKSRIKRIIVGQRSTHICPKCQTV